jgi:hypothetical protein
MRIKLALRDLPREKSRVASYRGAQSACEFVALGMTQEEVAEGELARPDLPVPAVQRFSWLK